MITASSWVPRGAAAQFPVKYTLDEKELSRISKLAKLQLNDAKDDLESARNGDSEWLSEDEESELAESTSVQHPPQGSVSGSDLKSLYNPDEIA